MRMFWVFMMLLRPDFLPLKFYVLDVFGDLHNFSIHAGVGGGGRGEALSRFDKLHYCELCSFYRKYFLPNIWIIIQEINYP